MRKFKSKADEKLWIRACLTAMKSVSPDPGTMGVSQGDTIARAGIKAADLFLEAVYARTTALSRTL